MWHKITCIALGGGLGALARYGLAGAAHRWLGPGFPWGTALVNLLGCFLFGLVWAMAAGRWAVGGEARALLLVGFMGAFTTFSTFVSETGQLLAGSETLLASLNVIGQVVAGLILYFLGLALGRLI